VRPSDFCKVARDPARQFPCIPRPRFVLCSPARMRRPWRMPMKAILPDPETRWLPASWTLYQQRSEFRRPLAITRPQFHLAPGSELATGRAVAFACRRPMDGRSRIADAAGEINPNSLALTCVGAASYLKDGRAGPAVEQLKFLAMLRQRRFISPSRFSPRCGPVVARQPQTTHRDRPRPRPPAPATRAFAGTRVFAGSGCGDAIPRHRSPWFSCPRNPMQVTTTGFRAGSQ